LDIPSEPVPYEVFCLGILGDSFWQKNGGLALVLVDGCGDWEDEESGAMNGRR